jgi:hypothetical protein
LPQEYQKCLVGINEVLKMAWTATYGPDIERREKIQALSLVKECYTTKMELLTNASILDDAMKFVSKHNNEQQQNQQPTKQQQGQPQQRPQRQQQNNQDHDDVFGDSN